MVFGGTGARVIENDCNRDESSPGTKLTATDFRVARQVPPPFYPEHPRQAPASLDAAPSPPYP